MPEFRWPLFDEDTRGAVSDFEVTSKDVPGTPSDWRIALHTLSSGLSQGVQSVEIDNGRLKFAVLPTRGMGLWRAWIDDRELGWKSPVRGPVHPAFVPLGEPSGLGFLSGCDELMFRCGLESNGAPDFDESGVLRYPLHGRIANRPAHRLEVIVDDTAGTISLHGVVEETRFHSYKLRLYSTYTTAFASTSIRWHDEVENFGGLPTGMQMLYHTNIGQPQLDAGSQFLAPFSRVAFNNDSAAEVEGSAWQHYSAPHASFHEQVFRVELKSDPAGQSLVLLKNGAGTSAVRLDFNTHELPCFTLWRNLVSEADGYVTGLEPATNFPNPRTLEEKAGRIVELAPEAKWQANLALDWLCDPASIAVAEQRIAQLQELGELRNADQETSNGVRGH